MKNASANAPHGHFTFESFYDCAAAQLDVTPLHVPGVCFNPLCSRDFSLARNWQRYCSTECRLIGEREMRRVGVLAAPAVMAFEMGRRAQADDPLSDLRRVARNYRDNLGAAWLRDRKAKQTSLRGGG